MPCLSSAICKRENTIIFSTPTRARISLAFLVIATIGFAIMHYQGYVRSTKAVWLITSAQGILNGCATWFSFSKASSQSAIPSKQVDKNEQKPPVPAPTKAENKGEKPTTQWKFGKIDPNRDIGTADHSKAFFIALKSGNNEEYYSVDRTCISEGIQIKDLKEALETYFQGRAIERIEFRNIECNEKRLLAEYLSSLRLNVFICYPAS